MSEAHMVLPAAIEGRPKVPSVTEPNRAASRDSAGYRFAISRLGRVGKL
jgi:hypothetical protein